MLGKQAIPPAGNRSCGRTTCGSGEDRLRVLVVEDHAKLAQAIAAVLRREGMAVDISFDGNDALAQAAVNRYDVIVLDRDLPGRHGDDVCQTLIAAGNHSGLLMLTASSTIEDKVEGLGIGADDYLAKPFNIAELVARIRALARRSRPALPPTLVHGDLRLDSARRLATRADRELELSPKEFAVLELLLAAQGAVVSAEDLLEQVWDEAANPFTNTVKMTISRLRAKLGDPPVITTLAHSGYRI
jgi:DNA-binding response OmpR family regulator